MLNVIRDLIADIRFCNRCIDVGLNVEENVNYRSTCVRDLQRCLAHRHDTNPTDQYGWPICLGECV